jgi:hypothetical protein
MSTWLAGFLFVSAIVAGSRQSGDCWWVLFLILVFFSLGLLGVLVQIGSTALSRRKGEPVDDELRGLR